MWGWPPPTIFYSLCFYQLWISSFLKLPVIQLCGQRSDFFLQSLKSLERFTSFKYGFVLMTRPGFPPPIFIFCPSSLPFPFSFFLFYFCVRDWTLGLVNSWAILIALGFLREGGCKPRFLFLGPQENSWEMCAPRLSSPFVKLGSIPSIWSLLCVWFILW